MSDPAALARADIRALAPYVPARAAARATRLNANEAPWRNPADEGEAALNRYPPARPLALAESLAAHYGVAAGRVCATRGSSEAIDALVRCYCRAGVDDIVVCPPTFGMYAVYAGVQQAGVRTVPLIAARDFALDVDGILEAWDETAKLVFVCSPNNPTGGSVDGAELARLCGALEGRGLVVVDGAYYEFSTADDYMALLDRHSNLVVLRTLSKALGLAGIRCGALVADPRVVELVMRILPPYSLPTPTLEAAAAGLGPVALTALQSRLAALRAERERIAGALAELPAVERVWPSEANFLLVRFADAGAALASAADAGLLLRDFSGTPGLEGCLRITVGAPADNDRLLAALAPATVSA